jgi:HPt (histidine-containing phosphotransfer) domain-containing protein
VSSTSDGAAPDPMARAQAAMQQIGDRALESNLRRLVELDEAVQSARHGNLTEDQCSAAVDVAHQLVGSAGTFGYAEVSRLARQLEHFFQDRDFAEPTVTLAVDWLESVRQHLAAGPDDD